MGLFDWLFGKKSVPELETDRLSRVSGSADAKWKVGDRVLASWLDGFFYPGRIRHVKGASCEVAFDDGDIAWVHQANVRNPDIERDTRVYCRYRAGPAYLAGVVSEKNGEKIYVKYENGEKEWTTISMVRVQRPLVNVPSASGETQPPAFPSGPVGFGPGGFGPLPGPGAMGAGMGSAMPAGMAPSAGPMGMPGMPFIPDVGDAVTDSNWRAGDRVLGRWFDFYWYPATILAMGSKGYHLLFDDGDQRVVPDIWLMPLDAEEGEEVFIRAKNQPQRIYTPARIVRVAGEALDVELEDGTRESNQRISRARFWRCPVGIRSIAFDEGDRVLAQDVDGFTYPAEILSIDGDKIIVHFLDGPERMLTPELLKAYDLQTGAVVECRWKGGQTYFRGKITQMQGDRIHIAYDDGDKEWTTIRLVRLPPI